jgi:hypothetical protein
MILTHALPDLITNRAGMPPWNTRIDWVELAIREWDLVSFTLLPLTRAYVRKVYIPGRRWEEVNGVSPITDPLFENADRRLLKALAKKPKRGESCPPIGPLMEASRELCYCRNKCDASSEHAIFNNPYLDKYIPDMTAEKEEFLELMAAQERELAEAEMQLSKKAPKPAGSKKERKGRRAMKKEAAAAAAASQGQGEPSQAKTTAAGKQNQAGQGGGSSEDEEEDVSYRMLELTDAVCDVFESLKTIVKS